MTAPGPGSPDQVVTVLRDGMAVGAARFALENMAAFSDWLDRMVAAPVRPCDELAARLLRLFIDERGPEVVGDALVYAAFAQKPEAQ